MCQSGFKQRRKSSSLTETVPAGHAHTYIHAHICNIHTHRYIITRKTDAEAEASILCPSVAKS